MNYNHKRDVIGKVDVPADSRESRKGPRVLEQHESFRPDFRAHRVKTVAVLAAVGNHFAHDVLDALQATRPSNQYKFLAIDALSAPVGETELHATIYIPSFSGRDAMTPRLEEAERLLHLATRLMCGNFILLSSALAYGTGCGRQGLAPEEYCPPRDERDRISESWSSLEEMATTHLGAKALTILRAATVLPSPTLVSRLLRRRAVPTLAGHDPVLQLLSISDLAEAICCVLENDKPGTFNVAPDSVVPLHAAIRLAGSRRISFPRTAQRLIRKKHVLEYFRYPWTISNEKIKKELGFVPRKSSIAALLEHRGKSHPPVASPHLHFDAFGMDKNYIHFYGKTLFKFLCDYYWRIDTKGLENIPREGAGLLVGTHRGFMPFDGVMSLHVLVQNTGRFPRFLTHPGLLKFPFLANFMTKLGGVVACQDTAERILQSGELVGIFPEGIHGAFSYYRDAYRVQGFGREAFIKMALRNRVPILPYVVVGSAEIFPIFGKINSRAWTRYTEWPCIPITPTFPLLPVPLPSKWHMHFLPPIHVERQYGPEAARDRSVVKAISSEVRATMQNAFDRILNRRRRIFWGTTFEESQQ